MGNNVVVSVEGFLPKVLQLVEENIDDNRARLAENLEMAAQAAADELSHARHVHGGSSPRWNGSISKDGLYDSGWFVYGRGHEKEKIVRVVANRHAPKLTHLLELGHGPGGRFVNEDGVLVYPKRRTAGDGAIKKAYQHAAPIAKGG